MKLICKIYLRPANDEPCAMWNYSVFVINHLYIMITI